MAKEEDPKPSENSLCLRCGRKLKSEESQKRGMGEICFKKATLGRRSHKLLFKSLHPPED